MADYDDTWRRLLQDERDANGDDTPMVIVNEPHLDAEPDGYAADTDFWCAWSRERVYFPCSYDGICHTWVASVARAPGEAVHVSEYVHRIVGDHG